MADTKQPRLFTFLSSIIAVIFVLLLVHPYSFSIIGSLLLAPFYYIVYFIPSYFEILKNLNIILELFILAIRAGAIFLILSKLSFSSKIICKSKIISFAVVFVLFFLLPQFNIDRSNGNIVYLGQWYSDGCNSCTHSSLILKSACTMKACIKKP